VSSLPDNTTLIANSDVWIEGEALLQLSRIAELPQCIKAVGLPDIHPGPGIPIGAAFAFDDEIRPLLVGGDAGCGVAVVAFDRLKNQGEKLMRRLDDEFAGDPLPDLDRDALLDALWRKGPEGLRDLPDVPESLQELVAQWPEEPAWLAALDSGERPAEWTTRPGTIGGGNHFLEVSRVGGVQDRQKASAVGLKPGGFAVVAHSGSRGLGRALIDAWGQQALRTDDAGEYLRQLAGCVRFARGNRALLVWRMLNATGSARRVTGALDVTHNTVLPGSVGGRPAWIHRKGSAPADAGEFTIVLGSRGAESWVMEGLGAEGCLCSVAHGAGRRMGRSEAIAKLRDRYTRASLTHTALGGRVMCPDRDLLYAEHPDVYKAIEPVVASLEAAGAAQRVAALSPLVTVKR
jgi:release factor H-coupled RctB family protein